MVACHFIHMKSSNVGMRASAFKNQSKRHFLRKELYCCWHSFALQIQANASKPCFRLHILCNLSPTLQTQPPNLRWNNSQLNPMVEQIIFRNILWIDRTSHNQFSSHGTTIDHLNEINEVLLGFKASDKLGMIWRPGGRRCTEAQEHKYILSRYFLRCTFPVSVFVGCFLFSWQT